MRNKKAFAAIQADLIIKQSALVEITTYSYLQLSETVPRAGSSASQPARGTVVYAQLQIAIMLRSEDEIKKLDTGSVP